MKKIIGGILAVIIVLCCAAYLFATGRLPLHEAQRVARITSGLAVPNSAKVLSYRSEPRFIAINPDYSVQVLLKLDDQDFDRLAKEAAGKGYVSLPMPAKTVVRDTTYKSPNARGLYFAEYIPLKHVKAVVLDSVKHTIYVDVQTM